jgi:hypothetical protein
MGNAMSGRVPLGALATKQSMMKGYWKVVIVGENGDEIEKLEIVQSKKLAVELALEINERGWYTTGISGFRYKQMLGKPLKGS